MAVALDFIDLNNEIICEIKFKFHVYIDCECLYMQATIVAWYKAHFFIFSISLCKTHTHIT